MIISTCSFGSTGSSVITDYLKEFDSVRVMDAVEMTWISAVDGILDLDYHLNNPHFRTADSISAIERYKELCKKKLPQFDKCGVPKAVFEKSVEEFLNSIVMTSWKWVKPTYSAPSFWEELKNRFLRKTKLKQIYKWQLENKRQWEGYPYEDVFLSVKPENFNIAAKKHIMDVMLLEQERTKI